MKLLTNKQIILLIAVVMFVVFAVTFVFTYLPSMGGGTPAKASGGIHFDETRATMDPMRNNLLMEVEMDVEHHHEFFFWNDSGDSVPLGLNSLGCQKCTEVAVAIAPEEQKRLTSEEVRRGAKDEILCRAAEALPKNCVAAQLVVFADHPLTKFLWCADYFWAKPAAAEKLSWQRLEKGDANGIAVHRYAVGLVRITWTKDRPGPASFTAGLWSGDGKPIQLKVEPRIVEPIQIAVLRDHKRTRPDQIDLGDPSRAETRTAEAGDLSPDTVRQIVFLCWSATRTGFSVVPQPGKTPCFTWGKPERLSNEECRNLENSQRRHVLCAYRVPLTIRERLDDKAFLDLGLFRYVIKMAVRDANGKELEPIEAWLTGRVRGEVTVITPKEREEDEANSGIISLGTFPARKGTSRDRVIRLESPLLDLQLVCDEEATAKFVEVELDEGVVRGTAKTWKMTVRVPPDRIAGSFPDRLPPGESCAIYLKMFRQDRPVQYIPAQLAVFNESPLTKLLWCADHFQAKPWKRLRIPVRGNATFQ